MLDPDEAAWRRKKCSDLSSVSDLGACLVKLFEDATTKTGGRNKVLTLLP